jgi:hypothetical protein
MTLLSLPTDILRNLVCSFLSLKELAVLLCSVGIQQRERYTIALQGLKPSEGLIKCEEDACILWMVKWGLCVENVELGENISASAICYLANANPTLRTIAAAATRFRVRRLLNETSVMTIALCCKQLKVVSLADCRGIDIAVRHLVTSCPLLEDVSLKGSDASDEAIVALGLHCKLLKSTNLANLTFSAEALWALASGCPHLSYLNMDGCAIHNITVAIRALARCESLNQVILSQLPESAILSLSESCRNLKSLSLSFSALHYAQAPIRNLLEANPTLRSVSFRRCDGYDVAYASQIANCCSHICALDFFQCGLRDESCFELARKCAQLQEICLSRCAELTDRGILAIAVGCPLLVSIDVSGCKMISDDALEGLSLRGALNNVNVSNCNRITDAGIRTILSKCTVLKFLSVAKCILLTDWAFSVLRPGSELTEIDINDCSRLTLGSIVLITTACKALKKLKMGCPLICDAAVEMVCCNSRHLVELDLCGCLSLTDASLSSLQLASPSLRILIMSDRPASITVNAYLQLAVSKPRIHVSFSS